MTEIVTWTVELAINVEEPDSDDIIAVARNGADDMRELLMFSGMQPQVRVTKTTTNLDPVSETVESWEVDLQDNSVWQ